MNFKIGQNVVDFGGDNLRYGYVVANIGGKIDVQFSDNGEILVYDDDEWIMTVEAWNRAGREIASEERAERNYLAMDY